ncbi:MAG: hypothetical protein ACRCS3_07105 [Paracoccaceae bacterium]
MNTEISENKAPTAEQMLAHSESILAQVAGLLSEAAKRMETGGAVQPKAVATDASIYLQAFERVMVERDKIGKLRNEIAGTVGRRSLDLDAARAEIGRRLACLRNGRSG